MDAGCEAGAAACRRLAPQVLQNVVPLDGAPHLLQNLETAAAGFGAMAAGWGGFAATRVSAPHLMQNTPLTGDPHLLQKFAMG